MIITCFRSSRSIKNSMSLRAAGGVQILMQGGHHPKLAVRLVSRSAASHPRKISAYQHSRIQPAGVSAFCRNLRDAVARSDRAIQGSRARLHSRAAAARFWSIACGKRISPLKCKTDRLAGSDAGRARTRIEFERDDDVRTRRDDRRSDRTSAAFARSAGRERRIHRVHLLDLSAAAHRA